MRFNSKEGSVCHSALFQWRWPSGFVCPECGHSGYCEIPACGLYQCHRCEAHDSRILAHRAVDRNRCDC
ncbi:MAG: transposase [Gammaproteobacteria bacterium]|nr:transposase [Gammaproteobacteria bacterium]